MTNTHTPATTSKTVNKVWSDNNNQDGLRDDVTLQLVAKVDGLEVSWADLKAASASGALMDDDGLVTLTDKENESSEFTNLPVKYQGKDVVYTVLEPAVPAGYSASYEQDTLTVTNTYMVETTDVTVSAIWKDSDDQDGIRPESITLRLMKNGIEYASKVVTAADDWSWTFTGLAKYEAGKLVNYTIKKDAIAEYDYNLTGDAATGFTVTYVYTPTNISLQVTKAWEDDDNQYGSRPTSVVIKLFADGLDTGKSLVLTEADNWTGTFAELPEYKNNRKMIYTIEEAPVDKYTSSISGDVDRGFVVTNCYCHEQIQVAPKTGENNRMFDTVSLMLLLLNIVLLTVRRKRKESNE